ncbi:MAG TPA: DUF1365 domain-containing protein [Nocardioidaceae bacterium]|nr:DUF1365 domain-containing protein [Nocardioidaceae bacterium]
MRPPDGPAYDLAGDRPVLPGPPVLPAIVDGQVSHQRHQPFRRRFRHRAYQWLVDLDDLPRLPPLLRPLASFRAADHLGDPDRSIKHNVEHFLALHGVDLTGGRVLMLANARVVGYVFDPLSVYWCYAADGTLACVVAEVHNTYGERHAYLLRPGERGAANTDKRFYVSPFFDVSGHYEMRFELTPDTVETVIVLHHDGRRSLTATFTGRPRPATRRTVLGVSVRHPAMPLRVSALIRWHGIKLWARGLPVVPRTPHEHQEGVR